MRHALFAGTLVLILLVLAALVAAMEDPALSPVNMSGEAAGSCEGCHEGATGAVQGGVLAAHLPTEAMLRGRGALGVVGMPSPHLPARGEPPCLPCHEPDGAATAEGGGATGDSSSCAQPGCHEGMGEEALEALAGQRQEEIGALLEDLQAALDAVADKDSEAYKVALANLAFVQADGSLGLHNYAYTKGVLESSLRLIQAAPEAVVPGQGSGASREVSPLASWVVTGMLALVPGSVAFLWRRRWLQ